MPYASLRDFIARLEQSGRLVRVTAPVSPHLEMTEIQTRLLAEKGPAVLFENVVRTDGTRSDIPVLVNLFGTVERVAWGMDREPGELRGVGETLAFLRQPEPPGGWREALDMLPMLRTVMAMKPRTVGSAPCQEIVLTGADIDLGQLPVQTCWPGEPAPLITWPLIVTQGPDPKATREDDFNLGIYRLQVIGRTAPSCAGSPTAAARSITALEGRRQARAAAGLRGDRRRSGDHPGGRDAGARHALRIPVRRPAARREGRAGRGQDPALLVPAQAEIVIEGEVCLDDYRDEGPYGDHTGYYNASSRSRCSRVTAITMRRRPDLSDHPHRTAARPSVLGEALNEVFIPLLRQQFPEIVDFWLPPEGCSYRIAVVSINKAYAGHAKRVMMGVWSYLRQFMYAKWVIVVDAEVDARNPKDAVGALHAHGCNRRPAFTAVRDGCHSDNSNRVHHERRSSGGKDW